MSNITTQPVATPVYEYSAADICADCAMWHANADLSGVEDEGRIAEVQACSAHVIVGDDIDTFSWAPCDACGTRLGGTRIAALIEISVR